MVITQPLLVAKVQQGCRVSISHKILCSEKRYFFFHCKIYNHDKLSSDISCQGIEEFEYLPSIRPKFKGKEEQDKVNTAGQHLYF